MRMRRTMVLGLLTASALAWPPSRRRLVPWLADVLAVTAHHLDHGPDTPPPADVIERGQRAFAGHVADALLRRQREAATEHHNTNGHNPQPI